MAGRLAVLILLAGLGGAAANRRAFLAADALRLPRAARARAGPPAAATDRRAFLAAAACAAAAAPAMAQGPKSVFDSTCLGFGCNNYGGQDFTGMAAPAGEESLPFADFIAQLKDKASVAKISGVDIYGAGGDRVYVSFSDGKKMRLGEGLPIDDSKGWSSPLWLVRILDNARVPHTYHFRPTDKP